MLKVKSSLEEKGISSLTMSICPSTPTTPCHTRGYLYPTSGHTALLRSLLLQIRLHPPLPRLAIIVLPPRLLLLRLVSHEPRKNLFRSPVSAALQARDQIARLALRLLGLTLFVLADALLLEAFSADDVADRLLDRAGGLIPLAVATSGIGDRDAARGGCGDRADFGGRVGEVVFSVCDGFLIVGFFL
jgi:hypothetical protein